MFHGVAGVLRRDNYWHKQDTTTTQISADDYLLKMEAGTAYTQSANMLLFICLQWNPVEWNPILGYWQDDDPSADKYILYYHVLAGL